MALIELEPNPLPATDTAKPEAPVLARTITTIEEDATALLDGNSTWSGADGSDSRTSSPTATKTRKNLARRGSGASNLSIDSGKDSKGRGGGISIGAAKPISGVVANTGLGSLASSSDEGSRKWNGH